MDKCNEFKVKPVIECGELQLKGCCEDICNDEKITLIICGCVPCEADPNTKTVFMDGHHRFELCDEGGHDIYADQIYGRMVLRCTAATDTMKLAVHNKYVGCGYEKYPIKRTCHPFPFVKCGCD